MDIFKAVIFIYRIIGRVLSLNILVIVAKVSGTFNTIEIRRIRRQVVWLYFVASLLESHWIDVMASWRSIIAKLTRIFLSEIVASQIFLLNMQQSLIFYFYLRALEVLWRFIIIIYVLSVIAVFFVCIYAG
jgi:hypothetical protein